MALGARDGRPQEEDDSDAGVAATPPQPGPPAGADREQWLTARLDAAFAARPELARGKVRVGVQVAELGTGRVLYARAADEPFALASNAKLITSAAALAALGPEYRFRTGLFAVGWSGGPDIDDLYLRGRGDPSFGDEDLRALAVELRRAGVRRVRGGLVMDGTPSIVDGRRRSGPAGVRPEAGRRDVPRSGLGGVAEL